MDNCRLNSSNPDSVFERMNKESSQTVFLQLFQLSLKTTLLESKQTIWSSTDPAFPLNVPLLDSGSVQWNSLKEYSPESVIIDHEEVILGSYCKFGPVTETLDVLDYSNNISCFDVETPSSIQRTCSDYRCCSDALNCSDDLSYSGGNDSSKSFDVVDQYNVENCHFSVRHRNSGLFSIDICSLVGQRYLQCRKTFSHLNSDDEMSYDLYCQWPMTEDTTRWLRPRPEPYPVTFKKELDSSSFTHLYKFSRAEQMEFAQQVGHWLNRRSRKLQRRMKPCFVPLARLPVSTLAKYLSLQPVVCLNPLSQSVITKWTKKGRVVNSSNKMLPMHHKRSGHPACHATSAIFPIVPLTRCDFKRTKMVKLLRRQSAKRVLPSRLNCSEETFSVKCLSMTKPNDSFGSSNFSENSSLYKIFRRKPTIFLNRIKLPISVSKRACTSNNLRNYRSHCLSMKQTSVNLTAGNCIVLLKDLGAKHIKKGNRSSEVIGQRRKVNQMKINQCFVSLTNCSRKKSAQIASTRRVELKRHKHSNPEWMCVKENHSSLTKSLSNVKSVRSNNNDVVLRQNRSNVI